MFKFFFLSAYISGGWIPSFIACSIIFRIVFCLMQIYHVLYGTKCLNKKERNQSYTHIALTDSDLQGISVASYSDSLGSINEKWHLHFPRYSDYSCGEQAYHYLACNFLAFQRPRYAWHWLVISWVIWRKNGQCVVVVIVVVVVATTAANCVAKSVQHIYYYLFKNNVKLTVAATNMPHCI